VSDFRNLLFYQKAFDNAMVIFELTKSFPTDEKYSLTSQMRKSSRSVCSNIAEGYRKRHFVKHFVAKISDADMENSETIVWLDFALACSYISSHTHVTLVTRFEEVGRMLNHVINNPEKFS
jgi:four helix bundle protein